MMQPALYREYKPSESSKEAWKAISAEIHKRREMERKKRENENTESKEKKC